jgi:predicted RNase H-like nuclease
VALGRVDGRGAPDVSVVASIRDLIARVDRRDLAALAIDIPIGLPEHGHRECDVDARRLLGPRRSSVFPAPVRPALACSTWDEANARTRAIDGRGLSHQVFNLLAKINEVDSLISPAHQQRVVEAHPELCFSSIAGAPLARGKHTLVGRTERAELLGVVATPLAGAAVDDVLDAHALLWTARRVARGEETRLGSNDRDARGLLMQIVF